MNIPLLLKACIVASAIMAGVASTLFFKLKNDNTVEEVAEQVIKDETGVDVDLTPGSPENKE